MQGQLIEYSKIRKSVWDGPFGLGVGQISTTSTYNFPSNGPYAIAINNGTTAIQVNMYDPTAGGSQVSPNVMWCHELINLGTSTGTMTVKGKAGGTIGSVPAGKRAELVWCPNLSEWGCFVSA